MKILLVANTLPPTDISGVGEQVLQLASGLRDRGHEVEVLGRGPGGARGPKILFPVTVVSAFLRRLERFRPDVVQVHESDGALVALLTAILAAVRAPRPMLVALLQVSYVEEIKAVRPLRSGGRVLGRPGSVERRFRWFKAPLHVVLGCLTAWLSDLVIAPSRVTANEISRDYQVTNVGVVPNVTGGLDWDAASRRDVAGDGAVVFVGRLRIRKGVEVLIDAIDALRDELPSVRLRIIGDGEQRRALERMVAQRRLVDHIEFLGRQSPEQVRRLLGSALALVVPSTYEGMPLVVLEAMERGVPVVASAVSGIPEVVVDGETGWLVPPEDSRALASALQEVLAGGEEAQRRGYAASRRVAEQFRPANAALQWEAAVLPRLPRAH